jgi:hypothetical protein
VLTGLGRLRTWLPAGCREAQIDTDFAIGCAAAHHPMSWAASQAGPMWETYLS